MKKAIIIGSGIGGIATALRLRSMNYDVTVFENNNYPGGKLASFDLGPYRFDAGPSLLTMPHFIDELFDLFNENPRDYFNYKKKDISCRYFWDDGTKLNAYSEKSKFINEINKVLGVKESTISTYLLNAKRKYDLTKSMFLEQSLHKLKTYLSKDLLIGLCNVFSFQINKTLNQVNELELKEPHLVQLFNRFATYNGSSPYKTPGMMTLVQHLEQEYGTYVSDKGMNNITKSLYDLALRQGIDFKFNSFVSQILVSGKRAIGVSVGEESYSSDIVVSNMDIVPTYRNLLKNYYQPEKTLSQERSSSALIFYWGIKKEFPSLDLHNIFFSDDYKQEFDHIFSKQEVYKDPTVYVNISSKENKSDAPKGCENWFVMVNVPSNTGQDWDTIIKNVRSNILKKLSVSLSVNLEDLIESETVLDPRLIESNTNSYQGALYGASSNNKFAAFLRHPNFSQQISNLYFCGGSVHPGGGIPLCLLSGKIVSELILKHV